MVDVNMEEKDSHAVAVVLIRDPRANIAMFVSVDAI